MTLLSIKCSGEEERLALLRQALATLPTEVCAAFTSVVINGRSIHETGCLLRVAPDEAEQLFLRAMIAIAAELDEPKRAGRWLWRSRFVRTR